jgi:glycosyltransferase involved in cell wall biosynthesis
MEPKVSIIMPVYNGEKFLKEAIESILNQTFTDFEFIIINDGSKDNSLSIIEEYKQKDSRIKIIDQKNLGIIKALNNGLKISKGKYIVRMDADDISLSDRIEKQLAYLKKENAYLCGTWAHVIDKNGVINTKKEFNYPPKTWTENKLSMIKWNPFIHPSVLFKRELYEKEKDKNGNLYKNYKHIEDYELWTRINPKYKSVNIQEYLLNYRIHNNQITNRNKIIMDIKAIEIRLLAIFRLIKSIF